MKNVRFSALSSHLRSFSPRTSQTKNKYAQSGINCMLIGSCATFILANGLNHPTPTHRATCTVGKASAERVQIVTHKNHCANRARLSMWWGWLNCMFKMKLPMRKIN